LSPWYSWNIAESGVKHKNTNQIKSHGQRSGWIFIIMYRPSIINFPFISDVKHQSINQFISVAYFRWTQKCVGICNLGLFWLPRLGPLIYSLAKTCFYITCILDFQSYDYECVRWRLFQKRVVCTNLDIYVFITITGSIPPLVVY
jgi:hypothetical protein